MAHFAVPKDGKIINIIIAETKEDADIASGADCIGYDFDNELAIGMVFDKKTKTWGFPESVA